MDARKKGLPRDARFSAQPHLGSLIPFFVTCAAYFLLWIPDDPPSWVGALVKCLPVLSLAGALRAHPGGDCSSLLQAALLFSAVGDVCLIWPHAFLYGVLAFGQAQLLYIWAFGFRLLQPGLLLPVLLFSLPFSCLLLSHLQPDMVLPLVAYGLALSVMLWRGLARGGRARWGALLFAISDSVLSWHTFIQPLAHGRLLVMATYYAAQFFIALSAFQGPRLKTN
ncbi:lysoplasmalogenase TMEM86B isoform X2 [Pteronotus mesoamericanus]|uniref:lysoplasmalogenase TMEM86B isoform X2 n=1 Tax=Pteronotus mesoamericanus TaxID=1884717 RepID=UPI0023EDE37E|nr:lysoplasmalogenase isoform X2 [Pteronotus parnellii mesoamericanus]